MIRSVIVLFALVSTSFAQDITAVFDRLDRLEAENKALRAELQALRSEVDLLRGAPPSALAERLEIQERRVEEHAQTKVEASQKLPIRITGMALFNAFWSGGHSGNTDNPLFASLPAGSRYSGATVRQTVLGLEYQGSQTIFGGTVRGHVFADFYSEGGDEYSSAARIRTASIEIDWKTRSLLAGVEKPIFAPREPNSLAQVGISPLTGAGNLWRWLPQVRLEQRIRLSRANLVRAQIGVLQTSEHYPGLVYQPGIRVEERRPGLEGRLELSHEIDDTRRFELAPGFHVSTSHVGGYSIPSDVFSLDWFVNPLERIEFTGAFFRGRNVAHFGATRQGYTYVYRGGVIPVRGIGGWAQLALVPAPRLRFNLMAGQHDDNNRDIARLGIAKNLNGLVNAMYRIAPNVTVSLEAQQLRTTYLGIGTRRNNRYDLAIAYMF